MDKFSQYVNLFLEGKKPDFLDLDKDGDKKEPMSKASKEAKGKGMKKPAAKSSGSKGLSKVPPQLRAFVKKKKEQAED